MKKFFAFVLAVVCSVTLGGCATPTEAPALYDLGAAGNMPAHGTVWTAPLPHLPPLSVAEIHAPAWLDNPLIYFRLAYANELQPRPYANSRWTMAPAQLLGQRLKSRLAQAGGVVLPASDGALNVPLLRIEADDFTQTFDSPAQSHALITLRASLFNGRTLLAQKSFAQKAQAPSADANGGARALAAASDALIGDLIVWLAALPPITPVK